MRLNIQGKEIWCQKTVSFARPLSCFNYYHLYVFINIMRLLPPVYALHFISWVIYLISA